MRGANGLTQDDVGNFHNSSGSVISNYEHGNANISAMKALELLQSLVATEEDKHVLKKLVSAIPDLAKEVRFEELVEQAERERKLNDYGTPSWIADMSGFNHLTVYARLKRRQTR